MAERAPQPATAQKAVATDPARAPFVRPFSTPAQLPGAMKLRPPAISNQAMQRALTSRVLQAKLTVNQSGDMYEQEADRVAEQVMRMPDPAVVQRQTNSSAPLNALQRKCAECEKEEQDQLQRTDAGIGPSLAPPVVHEVLRSPGQPLDAATRAFFEPRFDRDFRQVRVHTDTRAAESARAVNAAAYTVGRDVVFAAGQHAPQTADGKRLLAHELTHVVQQTNSRSLAPSRLSRSADREASRGKEVATGPALPVHPTSIRVQRDGPAAPAACCCCARNIDIVNIKEKGARDGAEWGHSFDAKIELAYEKADKNPNPNCVLEWWEKTDLPYGSFGMKLNTWTNIATADPSRMVWPSGLTKPCPGKETFTEPDDGPVLGSQPGRNATRTLDFAIRIKSASGCSCTEENTIYAEQKLTMKNGKGESRSFEKGIDPKKIADLPD